MNRTSIALALLVTATLAAFPFAEGCGQEGLGDAAAPRPAPGATPPNLKQPIKLLIEKAVQEELKPSPEQLRKLPEFRLSVYRKQSALGLTSIPQEDQEARQLEARERGEMIDKELSAFLTADQCKRLKQVDLQVRAGEGWGLVTVFRDPEVAKVLNFTESQKEVLADIRKEIQSSSLSPLGAGFGRPPSDPTDRRAERQKRMAELRKSNDSRIEQSLTEAQKTKWRELIGLEFKGKLELPGR